MSNDPFALTEEPDGQVRTDTEVPEQLEEPQALDGRNLFPSEDLIGVPEDLIGQPAPLQPWASHGGLTPSVPATRLKLEVDSLKKWVRALTVGGAAVAAVSAAHYYRSKPPRKRKTMTEGQKLGLKGMVIAGTVGALAGAGWLTTKVIANRVRGCKAFDLFC